MEEEEYSLERMLYIFVCNNKNILDKLYLENEIMEKVREKISALTEDFDRELYYDREELINRYSYEEGYKTATRESKVEIATSMLKDKVSDEIIIKYTSLTQEELDLLK